MLIATTFLTEFNVIVPTKPPRHQLSNHDATSSVKTAANHFIGVGLS